MASESLVSEPVKLSRESHARLEWARNALERAAAAQCAGDDTGALRDLAAVLVSLELVARRQAATPTASSATTESTIGTSRGPTQVRGSATDSGSLVPITSRPSPSEPGALGGNLIDTNDQRTWSRYMQEMYCAHPVAEGPPPSARSSTTPPLPLDKSLAKDLQEVLVRDPPAEAWDELLRKLVASLDTPPTARTRVDSPSSPPDPEPLPIDTVRAITASLTATRECEARRRRQAHRQAVATVLDHYLSTRCSDTSSRDSVLLDAIWPVEGGGSDEDGPAPTPGREPEATTPRTSAETTESTSDDDDDDDEADTRSLATGIREARESIARKDDKLTWLLGDGFRGGNVVAPTPASSSPSAAALVPATMPRNGKTKRTAAPSVMPLLLPFTASASSSSMFSAPSESATTTHHHDDQTSYRSSQVPHQPPHSHAHRRQGSNSSSFVTPLLRHRRSASTTGTGSVPSGTRVVVPSGVDAAEGNVDPRRLERQRSLSVGEGTHLLTLVAAAAGAGSRSSGGDGVGSRSGLPLLGPVVGLPRSPRTDKPFADLAPATAASLTGGVRTPTSSTSSSTPHILLDRNTLTNSERRELVRRSKKLEGFFGAPFQEATAQRVLVDGRLAPPLPLPPRSSEPDDCEGGDLQSPSEEPPTGNKPEKLEIDTAAAGAVAATATTSSAASSTVSPLSSPRRPTFSPPRRESLAAPRMQRSSSSPSRRSASFSSLASGDHTYYSEQSRWRFPVPLEDEQRQREREERRKKLEKVRRFLGERVPVEVVIPCHESPTGGGGGAERGPREATLRSGHVKSASDHWRRGKRLISGKRPAPTTAAEFLVPPTGAGRPSPVQKAEEWPYIEPNWQPDEAQLRAAEANHHNDAVDALSKARKLENLFGQLPPSSLYLGPDFGRPRPPPTLQHRHSSSDLASAYSPFAQNATVGGWVPATDGLGRSASSASSGRGGAADTYRRSIASLSYVAERDPDAMDEVVRVYAAGPREEPVLEADETVAAAAEEDGDEDDDDEDDDDEGSAPEATLMTRSVSAQSVRAMRQAQKLSQVLGTTKGAVWAMLLGDLQEAIMDDETLDEEERGDVLRSLDKLRRTAIATRSEGRS